ncbi:M23 family metallopeptidase [Microbacterium sp. VKM Ac-2923]|uniref:M23 family metallopeptidase n=1 Tax=Microbacterium sp. VKM Ac-2923 TaxID=2929476 RepID=UPI001FB3A29A|nr:M23 family metallopeptidase [Microbacterium sp. VKM Ac-2923]MCJ1709220.1 M23 family metallopeptidase [Microbacterium sp. VKM Ac-2923]
MSYITPADVGVSDDRDAHLARDSAEPGTDYKTAYGTDLRAPGDGRVIGVDHSNDGPEGRRLTFLMDNGEVIDWIHLAEITVKVNTRIRAGQLGIALSGASGFGKDRHYAPHLHVTRRARIGLPYRTTLDFEHAIVRPSTASTPSPADPAATPKKKEYPDMFYAIVGEQDNAPWYLVIPQGNAKPRAVILGANAIKGGDAPVIEFKWDASIQGLKGAVDGIL